MSYELTPLLTLIAALLTIELGKLIHRALPVLDRGSIPPAVTAGLLVSLALAAVRAGGGLDVRLHAPTRDLLLLAFFATIGFGAHLVQLLRAGRSVFAVCLAITVVMLAQNALGVGLAWLWGEPASLGLFLGSISFLGGHGTAAAWAAAPAARDLAGAFEVGIAAATLGLVLGGMVAGPVAARLARAQPGKGLSETLYAADNAPAAERISPLSSDRWLLPLLWILGALALGPLLQRWLADTTGLALPGFLAALLAAVGITTLGDLFRRPIDTEVTDLVGHIALRLFLAMALMGLDWAALMRNLPLIVTASLLQAALVVAVASLLVLPLLGRDRDAAAVAGGFIGYSLGAMPVGLAVMRRFNQHFGPTPHGLLAFTLAASLYTDTANALLLATLFGWLTP